ncbi:MAG: DUF4199 domain-containing protein [Balneolales bacterium]|nr:DUF4199 domain-containing protein [Balneolales bacterium]
MTKIELKFGLLYAAATLIWISIEYLLGFHSTYIVLHPYASFLFLFVAIAVIYQGMKSRKEFHNGEITYGQLFLSGVYITIVAVLVSPLTNYVFHSFINQDFFEAMIRMSIDQMRMTEDMAREHFNLKRYTQLNIVFGLISGVVISLFTAAILRKR